MIRGLVQGVGFRPFICRMAAKHGLLGEVDNRTNGVCVVVQGDIKTINRFRNDIILNAPPASQIKSVKINPKPVNGYVNFMIAKSKPADAEITEISPDIAVCPDCLHDLETDPERIDYPFINCTNCGPRFTIIEEIPYDRPLTTMKNFRMCRHCQSEYNDILDRRFHAQPIACNSCGPEYIYQNYNKTITGKEQILAEITSLISAGKTIAIKGIGGYHLMCDATNNYAVKELRKNKHRDLKPFAVMFRDISDVRDYCWVDKEEEAEITSWRRSILILKQKKRLASSVSNGLNTIGAMLPYMPVHFLMFRSLKTAAVVLTSGNISDEPVIIDDLSAEKHLMPIAGYLIKYNREISNRADDSVIRIIDHKVSIIRRSKGYVPGTVDLNINAEGILALGAEQKNSFCIGKGLQAVMSQYIGDLKNLPTYDFFKESIERFSHLFRFKPELLVCDLHPDYLSTTHAELLEKDLQASLIRVQHHHAHIASCMAEYGIDEEVIGICLDGTGYGDDGKIWGSEFMTADLCGYKRFMHFDYVPMPGGDKAVDEPWRMAYSFLYKYFGDSFDHRLLPAFQAVKEEKLIFVREMLTWNINSPLTSGAGRLFDAVSALLGLCAEETFDSEAPMRLESIINCETDEYYPFQMGKSITFKETFKALLEDFPMQNISLISAKFHNSIARIILQASERIRKETSLNKVVLSGGVFQNKYLLEKALYLLRRSGFEIFTNHLVPSNDGGISLGQLIIASKKRELCV